MSCRGNDATRCAKLKINQQKLLRTWNADEISAIGSDFESARASLFVRSESQAGMTPALTPRVVIFFCHSTQFEAAHSLLKTSRHLEGRKCVGVHWDITVGPRNVSLEELGKRFSDVEFVWAPSAIVENSTHPACARIARGQIRHLAKRYGSVDSWVFGFEFGWELYLANAIRSETRGKLILIPEGLSVFVLKYRNPWRSVNGKSALGLLLSGLLWDYLKRRKTRANYLHWLNVVLSLMLKLDQRESLPHDSEWDLILHQWKGIESLLPTSRFSQFVPPKPVRLVASTNRVLFLHDPKLARSINLEQLAEFMKVEFPQGAEVKSHPNPEGLYFLIENLIKYGYRKVKILDDNRRAEELIGSGAYRSLVGWTSTTLVYCALNFSSIRTVSIEGFEVEKLGEEFIGLSIARVAGTRIETPALSKSQTQCETNS